MKFKKQRDEEERLERAAKIKAHIAKSAPRLAAASPPQFADDEPLKWSQDEAQGKRTEPKAESSVEPHAIQPRYICPPLKPWERRGAFGRIEQWRPMTRAEFEAEQDAIFLKKQFDADQAHREKVRRAEAEEEAEQKATRKRAEREVRTGRRAYEPGRYCSVEEARRRCYLGGDDSQGHKSKSFDPSDNRGNLMGRFGA